MKNLENKLIEIFCHIDDFNRVFINQLKTYQLTDGTRMRIKPCSLNESEVMTIVIYFHLMRYRDFKHYYLFHVCQHMRDDFPGLVAKAGDPYHLPPAYFDHPRPELIL